jgi:chromosome partitioning protein
MCYEELERIQKNYNYKIQMRIVINKFDSRNTLSHETLSSLVRHPLYGEMLSKCYIRSSQEFPNCVAKNETIFKTLKQTVPREDIDLFVREAFQIHPLNQNLQNQNLAD